jgi:hypothetical protein
MVDVKIDGAWGDGGSYDPFQEPILLAHIPTSLRASLSSVALFLDGHYGVYDGEFFHSVVGLSNSGLLVAQVGKAYDADILRQWVPHSRHKHRLLVANCSDPAMATEFVDHFCAVYGGPPDNASFSMKFLRVAWATFKEKKEDDWVAEALKAYSRRMVNGSLNPKKLGPSGLRQ